MSSFQAFKSFLSAADSNEKIKNKQQNVQSKLVNVINQEKYILNSQENQNNKNKKSSILRRQKKMGSVCTFINKVYQLLEDKQIHDIVCWSQPKSHLLNQRLQFSIKNPQLSNDGDQQINSFKILNVNRFQEQVLFKYFKHSNLSSFIRQLNMYGFHKLRGQKGDYQFQHQKFIRNKPNLLSQIRRKHPQFIGISSNDNNFQQNNKKAEVSMKLIQGDISLEQINGSLRQKLVSQNMISAQQFYSSSIFPSQHFIENKQSNQQIKFQSHQILRINKIQKLQQQNNMLKKIKNMKIQKIKQINNLNKSQIQIKLSKIIFSILSQKILQQYIKVNHLQKEIYQKETNYQNKKNIQNMVNHVFANTESFLLDKYKNTVKYILKKQS